MKRILAPALAWLFMSITAAGFCAGKPRAPFEYSVASENDAYVLKTMPNGDGLVSGKSRWEFKGAYGDSSAISFDGKYVVRILKQPVGKGITKDKTLFFYGQKGLIASFSPADLVKDASAARQSGPVYDYIREIIGFKRGAYKFELITIDDVDYVFDASTGKILTKIKTNPPRKKSDLPKAR